MNDTLTDMHAARVADGSLRADPAQADVVQVLDALRQALEVARPKGLKSLFARAPDAPKGVYLWGGVGRGKSMLMDLFHASVAIPAKRRVHFHAFMQEVQAGIAKARKAGSDDAIRPVAEAIAGDIRLLCFDEMQITDIADAMIVGRLFQLLFDRGVTVVATSNRAPDDLYKDGLNRALFLPFIALLKDNMQVVGLDGPTDYRQHRLAGRPVYFTPTGAAARAAIDAAWSDLTGRAAGEPLVLRVNGRDVVLPQKWAGVARASFWDLCGRPLGPADYLAIAGAVRVLLLEDIPQLSSQNYNEARRFVTLIDALYESRVRLIASAAEEPERLYIEGAGSFEFERTASRLREMQGADWGV
jgi:cell division protein ZapE